VHGGIAAPLPAGEREYASDLQIQSLFQIFLMKKSLLHKIIDSMIKNR
jgi:hypothetical protein